LSAAAKTERLLEELRSQHHELLQALQKVTLLVLAERDVRAPDTKRIKTDLERIYELLNRNRRDRQERLAALIQ
jgi:hypothetical protein